MTRQRISLDGAWDFWKDQAESLEFNILPEELKFSLQVPAPWQAQFGDAERMDFGVGWYRRQFDLPPASNNKPWILHVGALDHRADVWVNGEHMGQHEGGYIPFEFDISRAARPGSNTLVVRAADTLEEFLEAPHGKQSWYGPISGIWQSVWLEQRPATHLQRAKITPSREEVEVEITLNRPLGDTHGLAFRLFNPQDKEVAAENITLEGNSRFERFSVRVTDPLLWSPEQPHLYRMEIRLSGESEDELVERFGFRTIEARSGRLYLNGSPLMLRGALDQDYYPGQIYTPPSEEMIVDQLNKAKEMGLNCLRVHIKVADPRYYHLADQMGLLIWTELPNWKYLTEQAKRRGIDTLEGILERDWNHPSIIIWTIINENWGTNLSHDPEHRAWLAETFAWLKKRDPLRLVVDNSACFGNFHVVTDIEDFHNYYAMPDRYSDWRDWVAAFANRPHWTFAPHFVDGEDWRRYLSDPWSPVERPYADEVQRKGDEPLVVSEFGNWGLPDLDLLRKCYDGQDPWWFQTGYEWDEGVVYPHGIDRRFYDFGLNQVFGNLSTLAQASQWSQFHAIKYEIEQMRRHESISGYIITEFTDLHWECNGLLDMCRNPKIYHNRLPEINGEDMFIPEWTRLAFWPGETVAFDLSLSHFSQSDLNDSRLSWSLEDFPDVAGQIDDLRPAAYGVTQLGKVVFTAPDVQTSRPTRLVFELLDARDQTAVRGSQVIYFLPRPKSAGVQRKVWAPLFEDIFTQTEHSRTNQLDDADIAVVYDITEDIYRFLRSGGQVLWMAEKFQPESSFLSLPCVVSRYRTPLQGDWASSFSWIRKGPLFTDLPTDGAVDFAFADLTPKNYITGILPVEFTQRVHAGIFAGWIQKNAALVAELPVGRGRVLISTFQLGANMKDHPVAAAMVDQMLRYLGTV
jgi:hypothetical protein